MTLRRVISIIIAAIVAVLIMYAGKSCAENIQETNRKNATGASIVINHTPDDYNYDDYTIVTSTQSDEEKYAGYETVTNLFGEVVATIPVTTSEEDSSQDSDYISEQTESETRRTILGNDNSVESATSNEHPLLGGGDEQVAVTTAADTEPIVIHIN
jgi:Tfp pilus assembly protein PilE